MTDALTTTTPKPFVFVLMPFADDFKDVYDLGIRGACEKAGAYCERVDEQVYEGLIIERIYNQISKADYIVAEMTTPNPNVFYEVGYARALGKKVILLTKDGTKIPFDTGGYPHIVYKSVASLQKELSARIRNLISQPSSASTYFHFPLKFLSDGKPIESTIELKLPRERSVGGDVPRSTFELDILNSPEQITTINFRMGVLCDWRLTGLSFWALGFGFPSSAARFKQPDGRLFHLLQDEFSLLPGAMQKFRILLEAATDGSPAPEIGETVELTFRVLTDAGVNDLPLSVTLT
jgi:nucleoside 2-deoxyribosyltransferase-like protein